MATNNVNSVIDQIKKLTPLEKKELAGELAKGSPDRQQVINESFVKANTIHTAPIGGSRCSYCGK